MTGRERKKRAGRPASGGERPRKAGGRALSKRGKSKPPRAPERPKANRRLPPPNRRPEPAVPQRTWRERGAEAKRALQRVWQRVRTPLIWVGRGALAVAIIAGAVAVGRLVEQHLRTSPAFATQHLRVQGNGRIERAELLEAAGLALGENVFEMAPERAEARLEAQPWVAEASVERKLPDTYEMRIRERQAAALLSVGGKLYLVSDEGTVFKELESDDPVDLPVITGIERERFVEDRDWRTSLLLEVVALLHDYHGTGLREREPIGEIHVEPDDGLSLYVGDDATLVRLGRGPYGTKLRKLRRVLDRLADKEARPAYVYLDNVRRPDRVTLKLR